MSMTITVQLLSRARDDLDAIWLDTAQRWGPTQAVDYLESLDAVLTLLAEFPGMGRLHREFEPAVRIHPFRRHLVIYRSDEKDLCVIRLLYARSNWMAVLSP